ncbi:hypothetical protein BGX27_000142 [Mortierella sp. AM989]|nr:hypothetical protein BGX27_000142 [Mortierella sp. AM989]
MAQPTILEFQERTFRIDSSVLEKSHPQNTTTKDIICPSDNSTWNLKLTRKDDDDLVVQMECKSSYTCNICKQTACGYCGKYPKYNTPYSTMRVVPRFKPNAVVSTSIDHTTLQNGKPIECTTKHNNVFHKNKYMFDVVFSVGNDFPKIAIKPPEVVHKNRDTMLILLKDINSVDTCFIFESDKSYSNVGLWAHRVILAKYKKFDEIIQDATKKATAAALPEKTDGEKVVTGPSIPTIGNPIVLTISVPKFGLATLSVLLRYIYTGEIQLAPDLSYHAVSMTKTSLVLYDAMGKTRESICWSPLDSNSPWKLKDVTWEELLLAADYFGVTDMRENCEEKVIGTMNESNVVDILFNIGCSFDTVKEAALDFIVKNMATLVLEGEDPFVAFKNHPDCHNLMFEVMRRRVKEASK